DACLSGVGSCRNEAAQKCAGNGYYSDYTTVKRSGLIVRHPNVLPSRRSTAASSASVLLDGSFAGRRAHALPLQLSHRVREHLENRKSLVSRPAVGKRYDPPRS